MQILGMKRREKRKQEGPRTLHHQWETGWEDREGGTGGRWEKSWRLQEILDRKLHLQWRQYRII